MNVFQKAWRRQKAVNRARLIRRYRKGHPKLGCYTCWYDCYEVEGDRCPECNAVIDRDVPWWRDGRFPLWIPAVMLFLVEPVKLLGTYLILRQAWIQSLTAVPTAPPFYYLLGSQAGSLALLLAGIFSSMNRTRRVANAKKRFAAVAVPLVAGSLLAWAVNEPLLESIGSGATPPPTPSLPQPSPASPASAPAP